MYIFGTDRKIVLVVEGGGGVVAAWAGLGGHVVGVGCGGGFFFFVNMRDFMPCS